MNSKSLPTAVPLFVSIMAIAYTVINPNNFQTLYLSIGAVLVFGLVIWLFSQTDKGVEWLAEFQQIKIEMRKVVWPQKFETFSTSGYVLIFTIVVAIFLWMVDSIFSWLVLKIV